MKRIKFQTVLVSLLLFAMVLFAGCSNPPVKNKDGNVDQGKEQPQLTPVQLLLPVKNINEGYAPFVVAKQMGYFEQEGLDVELKPVAGSNEVTIQVAAGNGQVGFPSPAAPIIGLQPAFGMKVKFFYAMNRKNIWSLSVLPDSPIKEVKDLKGKVIGVSGMGSSGIPYGKAFAAEAGLDPEKDITFVAIGVGSQAASAIEGKKVDAVAFWDDMVALLETTGLKLRQLPISSTMDKLPDAGLLATNDFIEKNPDVVVGMGRAMAKATEFTLANPEAAVKMVWAFYPEQKPSGDQKIALENAVFVLKSRFRIWRVDDVPGQKYGFFVNEEWSNVVDFLIDQKMLSVKVPLEQILTNEFIDQINDFDRDAVRQEAKNFK